ncbi:hypothetical protein FQN49_004920 [Arthroderma sp. PD_2]|nr:hypothetical protein FQN49_004920 [Arthroderma sp. PD_2]
MLCVENSWPCLLVGSSGCGKTSSIRRLAALSGAKLVELALNSDTDAMDLIGGFEQKDGHRQYIAFANELVYILRYQIALAYLHTEIGSLGPELVRLYQMVMHRNFNPQLLLRPLSEMAHHHPDKIFHDVHEQCKRICIDNGAREAGFEWTEGILIHAMQQGNWVVLDNANLCNATVLDRLNSLLEPNGCLIVNERKSPDGLAQVVTPHPNFRLFLTVDPRHGELSRAMRNRSVEIFFLQEDEVHTSHSSGARYLNESAIYRIRECQNLIPSDGPLESAPQSLGVSLDHLSPRDLTYLHHSIKPFVQLCTRHSTMTPRAAELIIEAYNTLLSRNALIGRLEPLDHEDVIVCKAVDTQEKTEPLHPLINEPRLLLSFLLKNNQKKLVKAGKLHELQLQTVHLYQDISQIELTARNKKSSEMSPIERSMTSMAIQSHLKDSTQPVAGFLYGCCSALNECLETLALETCPHDALQMVEEILHFCRDVFQLTQSKFLDNAVFLTYLLIGKAICSRFEHLTLGLRGNFAGLLSSFNANWKLSTGESMQRMWNLWRPATPTDFHQLEQKVQFQELRARYDQVALRTRVPIHELGRIHDSFLNVQASILHGADSTALLPELNKTISHFEAQALKTDPYDTPHFATEFETLCQYNDLLDMASHTQALPGSIRILSGRASRPNEISSIGSAIPSLLSNLTLYLGSQNSNCGPFALLGNISNSLVYKFESIGQVPLGQIDLLESEIGLLFEGLAANTCQLTRNQPVLLQRQLAKVFTELLMCHIDFIDANSYHTAMQHLQEFQTKDIDCSGPSSKWEIQNHPGFADHTFSRHLLGDRIPSLLQEVCESQSNKESITQLGELCVRLSIGLLHCYVPNRPFDPSLSLAIEHQQHTQRRQERSMKLDCLRACELTFSGQKLSLRIQAAEEELENLGSTPPNTPVTRPEPSRLDDVQAQFTSILNSVLNQSVDQIISASRTPSAGSSGKKMSETLLQLNIRQIASRLSVNCPGYDDITILPVRFLQLLDQGIGLVRHGSVDSAQDFATIHNICRTTPFLGPHLPDLSLDFSNSLKGNQDTKAEVEIHRLLILGAAQSIDEQTLSEPVHKQTLHGVLDRAYGLWKEKLEKDQSQELEKSKLYHYRGSFEDDEQSDAKEMLQLFPTYDNHDDEVGDGTVERNLETGDLRMKFFTAFKNLFASGDKTFRLKHAVKEASRLVGSLTHQSGLTIAPVASEYHLAPVFLLLEDIHQTDKTNNFNFYTDSNTEEVKRLASLVQKVQIRFLQLQESWPEHATLTDVINWCSKIFKFQHREPLAKFLTMAEKLHEHVHEWQTVASKEFSAVDCYNDLTSILIHWRRLELSTWSRLLDVEDEKCQEHAASWWYMAYEVIVAVPLQLVRESQQLDSHVAELLVTLEKFLHATPIGQFSSRVDLIEKFKLLLTLYAAELPALSKVTTALDNLLSHYRPFICSIDTSLQNGRKTLEKELKEQVQLASWKDTNITALRESARRSHHTLFKIIRKYRRLLAQPCEELLSREIPGAIPEPQHLLIPEMHSPNEVASTALNLYQKNGELWDKRPARFQNPNFTARNMCRVYEGALPEFQATSELEGIMNDVVMSISDFQKRTPKTLTKENKDEIQHLKTQKRSFYATKLKELRHMGLRSNLGTDLLDMQRSVTQVLAATPCFDFSHSVPAADCADKSFHRFLHMIPSVRQAARNYSEDLSNVEAGRSAGFTEGFLYQMLRQREVLSPALASLDSLESNLKLATAISSNMAGIICSSDGAAQQQHTIYRALKWLPTIIDLSSTILSIHGKHSITNSSAILSSLSSWRECINSLQERITSLPSLPPRLSSQSHAAIAVETKDFIASMKSDILDYIESKPGIGFAFNQLLLWTEYIAQGSPQMGYNSAITSSLQEIDSTILAAMDKILVALQRVQISLSSAPTSADIAAWLSKTDVSLSRSIAELHIEDISSTLRSIFGEIEKISEPNDLDIAIAGIGVILPILEQYQSICSDLVNRYAVFHYTFCKFGHTLAKSFKQVASEGFCSPSIPSEQQGQSDKVESGTGLGDGEGAEDISKDIQDDEDLSELAQQKREDEENEEMEGTEDAVNMDHEELEGQEDEFAKEKEDGDEGESDAEEENDLDEEVGSVDGWDPSAVDEKMWDGANDKEQKDTENNDGKGDENTEEISAAAEQRKDEESAKKDQEPAKKEADEEQDAGESDEDAPEDEQEGVGREDKDVTDPHAQENEVLDLPEDMDLDGDKEEDVGSGAEDGMSEISMEDAANQEDLPEDTKEEDNMDIRAESPDAERAEQEDGTNEEGQAEEAGEQESEPQQDEEEDKSDIIPAEDEQQKADPDNTAPSDQVSAGVEHDQSNEKGSSGDAAIDQPTTKMEEDGEGEGDGTEEQGQNGKQSNLEAGDGNNDDKQDPHLQAFKKLGDILEQWHRSHREILEASEKENEQSQEQEIGEKDVDFEHLADDEDTADTQALGQANEEQSQAMNQSKAIESDFKPQDNEYLPDAQETEDSNAPDNLEDLMEVDAPVAPNDQQQPATSISRSGTGTEPSHGDDGNPVEDKDDLDDVDTHLSIINLSSDSTPLTPPDEARRLWTHYESITHDLSLSLTEQLRLILAPTMATKLRGDFRTGKRLNIKRIIPYIASQYKRDKIWMRRSVPSKRNYQIMLAVDDSKSMLEGASGQLAFQTLALVARSLSMLEAGDLCIVSFGNEEHIRVAHDFGKPFSSEAGSQVFQHFSYKQTGTNVRQLIADSVTLFREARAKRPSSSATGDLWQLELIISDGICEDHERIARLVRQAHEERIMLVFIIVDAVQEESRSIMNLSQATFESNGSGSGDGKWKMKKYLDGFPFPYYLIVRNVQELPAVLSLALKQWFAEVVEVSS